MMSNWITSNILPTLFTVGNLPSLVMYVTFHWMICDFMYIMQLATIHFEIKKKVFF